MARLVLVDCSSGFGGVGLGFGVCVLGFIRVELPLTRSNRYALVKKIVTSAVELFAWHQHSFE